MKTLSPALASHLASRTITLCHCWKLTTRAGAILGFTDHDRTLIVGGVSYGAQSGFTGSEIESALGFSVDNLEATGALQSGVLDSARLKAGDFDHAEIEIRLVNWQDVSQQILLRKGHLGEVSFGEQGFTAEVRGLSHLLNQPKGRLYKFGCDANLGDGRCQVNLAAAAYRGTATVTAVSDDHRIQVSGLGLYADDWFTRGKLQWATGANVNRMSEIKRHRKLASYAALDLWSAPAFPMAIGDTALIFAGCDKQFSTCRTKFFNATNFRGFPHMPGSDFVVKFAAKN
jgi:uncharacterized phage protein (TIGR02218 family)